MTNHARRRRATAVRVCLAGGRDNPCTNPARYDVTFGSDPCRHASDPVPVCHLHAYRLQQQPIAPGLAACPACHTLGRTVVVKITEPAHA